jgi:hypothetical protein
MDSMCIIERVAAVRHVHVIVENLFLDWHVMLRIHHLLVGDLGFRMTLCLEAISPADRDDSAVGQSAIRKDRDDMLCMEYSTRQSSGILSRITTKVSILSF